jgi:mannose-6-phosphate isomerase-like protein (cupin superfamily)
MLGDAMLLRPLAWGGKFRQPGRARSMTQRRKFWIWALLALGGGLPVLACSGEMDFSVVQVETHQAFQRYDGFQLATLAQTSAVNIRVNRLEDRIKRHTHPSSHHFLYFIKGQVELRVGDETIVVGSGDFVTIPQGTSHAMQRIGDSEAVFLDVASPPDVGDVIWHE